MTTPSIIDDYKSIRSRAQEIEQVKKAALEFCRDTALTFILIREDNIMSAKLFRDVLEASGWAALHEHRAGDDQPVNREPKAAQATPSRRARYEALAPGLHL